MVRQRRFGEELGGRADAQVNRVAVLANGMSSMRQFQSQVSGVGVGPCQLTQEPRFAKLGHHLFPDQLKKGVFEWSHELQRKGDAVNHARASVLASHPNGL